MNKDLLKLSGGIIVRMEVKRYANCDISGSTGKYAFRATVFDTNADSGIMGNRIVSFEMWRAKKTLTGYIKVFPILRCDRGRWTLRPGTKNDFDAACFIIYSLNNLLPTTSTKS